MIAAGLTLGVIMGFALAFFIGKKRQEFIYRRELMKARESQLGPVIMLEAPREIIPAKALSAEQLAEMCIARPSRVVESFTHCVVERQKIVQEVHPWREAAND